MEESSSNLAAGEVRRHQTSPHWANSDLDTWYRSLQQVSKSLIYSVVTVTAQRRIHKIQNGVTEILASYIDTIYFTENSLQIMWNRPFAASHWCGTKPPRWRAKVALGQDKQKTYIIWNSNFLCLSCPSATFALQHGSFEPREWLAAKGLFHRKRDGRGPLGQPLKSAHVASIWRGIREIQKCIYLGKIPLYNSNCKLVPLSILNIFGLQFSFIKHSYLITSLLISTLPLLGLIRYLAVRTMSSAVDLKNTRPVSLLITRAGVHGTRQPRFGARVQLTSRTFPLTSKRAWWSLARGRLRLSTSTLTRTTLPFIPPSMLKVPSGIFWGPLRNGMSKNTLVAITRFQMSP